MSLEMCVAFGQRVRTGHVTSIVAGVLQFVNRTVGSLLSPSRRCHIPALFCSTVAVMESKISTVAGYWERAACMAGCMWSDRGYCCEYREVA